MTNWVTHYIFAKTFFKQQTLENQRGEEAGKKKQVLMAWGQLWYEAGPRRAKSEIKAKNEKNL